MQLDLEITFKQFYLLRDFWVHFNEKNFPIDDQTSTVGKNFS